MIEKKQVVFSDAEDEEIKPFELLNEPHRFIILSLDSNFVCRRCNKLFTIHKSAKCITFRCGCECRIIYPKNKEGIRLTTVIMKNEHIVNGGNNEN